MFGNNAKEVSVVLSRSVVGFGRARAAVKAFTTKAASMLKALETMQNKSSPLFWHPLQQPSQKKKKIEEMLEEDQALFVKNVVTELQNNPEIFQKM